ncbi:LPS assembly lipoprotein LptE [Woodsholea maritima]|uniref:LPS assembly lipoprotein LptE n=1 Tax=Woodsholea maritima TaxID=240237 RepID=UPI000374D27A|nr:LPS assembly lipoprotein LptE [Woodsholea maritima]
MVNSPKLIFAVGISVLTLTLSACGFRPLYSDQSLLGQLTAMQIEAGDERVDYFLQQSLENAFGSVEEASPYRLVVQTTGQSSGLGISASDIASRFRYDLRVNYQLINDRRSEEVTTGRFKTSAFYDAPRSPYALYTARQDAETRAANDAADRLARRLIAEVQAYERRQNGQ